MTFAIIAALLLMIVVLMRDKARAENAAREAEANRERVSQESRAAGKVADEKLQRALEQQRAMRLQFEEDARAASARVQATYEKKSQELDAYAQQLREHYEGESTRLIEQERSALQARLAELEPLQVYAGLRASEIDVQRVLADAMADANALRQEAELLVQRERAVALEERQASLQRTREVRAQLEARLLQATRDAARIVADAEKRAEETGGEAFLALREKQEIERALVAIRNVVDGYGDRYVVPTHSLLDDLAEDFGHTTAGEELRAAREHSRRLVEAGAAADCDYAEPARRETAVRFVIDAFNGRVDASLSTVKSTNFGTLEQEICDAFSMVNLNGQAFRNARIHKAYLDARLSELKWAVVAQELKQKEREEQRQLQEQIREEEKARRDYERAVQEAAKEEAVVKQALEKARLQAETASVAERGKYEAKLAELELRLTEAEQKNRRALSMAQQTRSGHVYVISNIGSFGDEVFKIGMTRRLDPLDRIRELGDASVPFEFDIHAMIRSEDAPKLERLLHTHLDDHRINKVNYRKEFFRTSIERIREVAKENNLEVTFTMTAEAREYRETAALARMSPEERARHQGAAATVMRDANAE